MHSLVLVWASWILSSLLPPNATTVDFYHHDFEIEYRGQLLTQAPLELSELGITAYRQQLGLQDWSAPLQTLEDQRTAWQLNDWLYYRMVEQTVRRIAAQLTTNERRLLSAHLLHLSGYDVRVCYDTSDVFVYARTEEALFEVPIITDGGQRFVNLTAASSARDGLTRSLKFHPLVSNPTGKPLSFSLDRLPKLPPRMQERVYTFSYRQQVYKVHALSDRSIVAWMSDYPIFDEGKYVETALSPAVASRLYEELTPLLADKTELEQLELLAAFTRGAFVYKEDKRSYGFSKPMIPDEVLHYPVSDCEDRSALYFALVRDLLNLPVVAIAYNDHLSVGVSSKHLTGKGFTHDGRYYRVCDPTGPANSSDIGEHPYGYANRRFKVVASYVPTRC